MLIREGDAQRSSMMQCKKRPGDVAIEPLVSFKKTVSMEKKKTEVEDRLQNGKDAVT